jgi:hypothetical protein
MKAEEIFGVSAGKVWQVLSQAQKPLTLTEITRKSSLKTDEVLPGLGWLGKEGKIEIVKEGSKVLYKLSG